VGEDTAVARIRRPRIKPKEKDGSGSCDDSLVVIVSSVELEAFGGSVDVKAATAMSVGRKSAEG
jgi:hypothetical protein